MSTQSNGLIQPTFITQLKTEKVHIPDLFVLVMTIIFSALHRPHFSNVASALLIEQIHINS